MKVSVFQFAPSDRDVDANLQRLAVAAAEAAEAGSQLLVLPERTTGSIPRNLGSAESTERLLAIARNTGVSLLVGMAEKDGAVTYNAAVLITPRGVRGKVRQHLPGSESFAVGPSQALLNVGNAPMAVLIGDEWRSTERVRDVLAQAPQRKTARLQRPQARVLIVLTRDLVAIRQRAVAWASSDFVTVICCNATAPLGAGRSIIVTADGEIAAELGEAEQLVTVTLIRERPSPLAGLPSKVRFAELPPEVAAQVREAIFVLIGRSYEIREEVCRQGQGGGQHVRRVISKRLRNLWGNTPLGELWKRMAANERGELIEAILHDIESLASVAAQYGLGPLLEHPASWHRSGPVHDFAAAATAVFWKGVYQELKGVLATESRKSRYLRGSALAYEFKRKLGSISDDPASIFYLTYAYVRKVARNFLVDLLRKSSRDAQGRRRRTGDFPHQAGTEGYHRADNEQHEIPGTDYDYQCDPTHPETASIVGELRRLLADCSELQKQIVKLRCEDFGVSEIAEELGLSVEHIEENLKEVQDRIATTYLIR